MRSAIAAERIFGEHLPEQIEIIKRDGDVLLNQCRVLRKSGAGPDDTISAALWEIWVEDVLAAIGRIGKRGRARKGRGA